MFRASFRPPAASGAIAAQGAQSGAAFVIQVLASRELGAGGFAIFALLYGALIMATAVSSGLIGDSLTVLDRHDPAVRSALLVLATTVILTASVAMSVGFVVLGSTALRTALVFAAATAVFMLADLCRRVLMATLRFWRLALTDLIGLVAALSFLGYAYNTADTLGLVHFLLMVTVGQLTAAVSAIGCMPRSERHRPHWRRGAIPEVMRFGGFRAAQQFVRPTMLNVARWIVLISAGRAVLGEIEAARVYVAPAMLLVQGVGSYLLASYAADKAEPTRILLGRADRAAASLLLASTAGVALAVALTPVLGPVMTAGEYQLSVLAVLAWGAYAASCAAVLPYGTLAAARGRAGQVLGLRALDSAASITLVATVLLVWDTTPYLMPMFLSVGSFAGGILCRNLLVRPMLRDEHPSGSAKRS